MPVCSYLVIPEEGAADALARRLASVSGCDVARAENRDVLLLVTDTPGPAEDRELRSTLEDIEGLHALVLTFGEIDPDTEEADPVAAGRVREREGRKGRRLPVVDPGTLRVEGGAAHLCPASSNPSST